MVAEGTKQRGPSQIQQNPLFLRASLRLIQQLIMRSSPSTLKRKRWNADTVANGCVRALVTERADADN
jgi:hypothetical protein